MPHTVIREDPSLNLAAAEDLETRFPGTEIVLLESGGDNLASTFSSDLVDYWLFVIDVAGGDDPVGAGDAPELAQLLAERGLVAHLSISDEKEFALAFVVLEHA